MKKKKLVLKKETIVNLSNEEMTGIKGGLLSSYQNEKCEAPSDEIDTCRNGSGTVETGAFAGCTTAIGNCIYSKDNCQVPTGFGCPI